ncbi:MAG: hypothetical protein AAFV97_03790 [Bacteroidota bacterium]
MTHLNAEVAPPSGHQQAMEDDDPWVAALPSATDIKDSARKKRKRQLLDDDDDDEDEEDGDEDDDGK